MKNLRLASDKAAIGISMLCVLHCLALPVLIVLLPSMSSLPLNDEAFHSWLIFAVIPTSLYALTLGCHQHKNYGLLKLGSMGLGCLVLALVIGEAVHSELLEKLLTTLGAAIIAYAHYKNYRRCQDPAPCGCSEH